MASIADRQQAHDVVYDACRLANERGMTLADALSADERVSSRIDRATIDRLTSPKNYLGLAPENGGSGASLVETLAQLRRNSSRTSLSLPISSGRL